MMAVSTQANGFKPHSVSPPASPPAEIPESTARLDPSPLKLTIADRLDDVSTVPAVGTPADPESIPVHAPNGTPPPKTGELLEDVQMAERRQSEPQPSHESEEDDPEIGADAEEEVPMIVDDERGSSVPRELNGINGHHCEGKSDTSPPPDSQPERPAPIAVAIQLQPSPEPGLKVGPKLETQLDEDLPRPAKRAKLSDDGMDADRPSKSKSPAPVSSVAESALLLCKQQEEDQGQRAMKSESPRPPIAPNAPPMTPMQHRFCLSMIRTIRKLKDAAPFLSPVDPVALNIPHYSSVIRHPMDLATVQRKLHSSNPQKPDPNPSNPRYNNTAEFIADLRLIWENCATFNGPDHFVTQMARRLESICERQIKQIPPNEEPKAVVAPPPVVTAPPPPPNKAPSPALEQIPTVPLPPQPKKSGPPQRRPSTSVPTIRRSESDKQGRPKREIHPPAPKDLPYADAPRKVRRTKVKKDDGTSDQLKYCQKILADLHRKSLFEVANFFYEPVDYIKLQIPSYPKIIKKPMDMSTIRRKLEAGEYTTSQDFHKDFKQMLKNCYTFNPPGTLVYEAGQKVEKVFEEKWRGLPPLRAITEQDEEDEEEVEEDSEDDQAKTVALLQSQIELLQGNLAAMKKKPKKEKKIKKEKKASSSSSAKVHSSKPYQPSSSKSSKQSKKANDVLSFEQKKDLSDTISTLDGPKLERVIQIIHEGVPEIRDSTEEIELDIDSLPHAVLMKLYNFVLRPIRNPPKRSRGVGGGTGGLKRKSMDEDVEAERIRQLEERIALFNGDASGAAAGAAGADESAQSSDESSDDSSGSDSE